MLPPVGRNVLPVDTAAALFCSSNDEMCEGLIVRDP